MNILGGFVVSIVSFALASCATIEPSLGDLRSEAMRWTRAHAHPITTTDPHAATGDLAPINTMIGGARVAAFGEATHGSREFFQIKHRAFQELVSAGFSVFAIEANFADTLAINAYVGGGDGDPEALISGMRFWTWDTEEVLALVEWMRAYNAEHERKIRFYGIDIQYAPASLRHTLGFLVEQQDPLAVELAAPFQDFLNAASDMSAQWRYLESLPPNQLRALRQSAQRLHTYLSDRHRAQDTEYAQGLAEGASLAAAWFFMMEAPHEDWRFTGFRSSYDVRDRAMADMVRWILRFEGEQSRVFVWAHNSHVSRELHIDERQTMGGYLSEELGRDYVSFGFAFDSGAFQAMSPAQANTPARLQAMQVDSAPREYVEGLLAEVDLDMFALDLRELENAPSARAWFDRPRDMRWTGAQYSEELMARHPPINVVRSFDALIFVRETTRARPLQRTRDRFGIERSWHER
jgi:erythromycin esterase